MGKSKTRSRILYIVEGHQELDFLEKLKKRNLCDFHSKRRLGYNITNASPKKVAQSIHEIVKRPNRDCSPIIVLVDRDKKGQETDDIIDDIKRELEILGHDKSKFIIGIADQQIETWMLPFVSESGEFPVKPERGFDGTSGTGELEKRLKNRGKKYVKRKIGIEILLAIDPSELAKVSDNFKHFYEQVKQHCKWFNRKSQSTN